MIAKPSQNHFAIKKRTVFLVDDHPVVRQGLTLLINQESDLMVCGQAGDMHSAISEIRDTKPDIVIMDISLDGPDGLELLKQVRLRSPRLPVLILSMHDESIYAERALRAGANGYIMKAEATEKVMVALRRILSGEIYVSDRIANSMLQHYVRGADLSDHSPVSDLTDRELEVFRLIGKGQGTRQIADALHLSVKTVETHQSHIKEKLCLRTGRELVQHAVQWNVS